MWMMHHDAMFQNWTLKPKNSWAMVQFPIKTSQGHPVQNGPSPCPDSCDEDLTPKPIKRAMCSKRLWGQPGCRQEWVNPQCTPLRVLGMGITWDDNGYPQIIQNEWSESSTCGNGKFWQCSTKERQHAALSEQCQTFSSNHPKYSHSRATRMF